MQRVDYRGAEGDDVEYQAGSPSPVECYFGPRRPLSPRQDAVLCALVLFIARHRRQPSHRELARVCGLSSVQKHLLAIEAKGWIRGSGRPRAIEIPADVYDSVVDAGELPRVDETSEATECQPHSHGASCSDASNAGTGDP